MKLLTEESFLREWKEMKLHNPPPGLQRRDIVKYINTIITSKHQEIDCLGKHIRELERKIKELEEKK